MTARSTLIKQAAADAESTKAPAKKTTTRKTVAKKAPAKKAAVAEKVLKKEQTFEQRDWTYLDEKDPSEQHVLLAKEINRRTNDIDIDAKQVQAVLAMFPHFQRSATNKNRSGYVPLAAEIVHQRSIHMTQAHADARLIMDGLVQEANAKPVKKAAAKKASPSKPAAATATKKATPARKARVTKKAAAPAATEAF